MITSDTSQARKARFWSLIGCAAIVLAFAPVALAAQAPSAESGEPNEASRRRRVFKIEISGRLQIDTAVHDNDDLRLDDGTNVRRARLALEGALLKRFEFKAQVEFGAGVQLSPQFEHDRDTIEAKDIYLRYRFSKRLKIIAGQFKEPFSLEDQTSSNNTTFLERGLSVDAFSPGRNIGLALQHSGDHSSLAVGVFRGTGFGIAARGAWAPVSGKRKLLHLGVGGEYREPGDGKKVRFRARPESAVSGERLVRTRRLGDIDSTSRLGVELAAVKGALSVQGEYFLARISRPDTEVGQLTGWYASLSWFLSGESRPYKVADGAFGRIKPKRGMGAVEVAVRLSHLDLDDGDIRGGREQNLTLALNWYLSRHARLMANYVRVDAQRRGDLDASNIFQIRGQLTF